MSNSALIIRLRTQALEKLHESSMLFEQAYELLGKGKAKEAKKLRDVARTKRADSAWLMREAAKLEDPSNAIDNPE